MSHKLRIAFICFLTGMTLMHTTLAESVTPASQTPADAVEVVRSAVVQVGVNISGYYDPDAIPSDLKNCFRGLPVCMIGTGFFVNADGDVVTASHVANRVEQIIQNLSDAGIHGTPIIAVSFPNIEIRLIRIMSSAMFFPAIMIAADIEHDVAALHPAKNPFVEMGRAFAGPDAASLPRPKATFVKLDSTRPRDAEEIFTCGFPFGEPGLVTTSGMIASSGKSEKLLTSKTEKPGWTVDVYWVDLRINPGNSGGPVFRTNSSAVLGIAVERREDLGIVVPAKYIADFLQAHDITFSAVQKN